MEGLIAVVLSVLGVICRGLWLIIMLLVYSIYKLITLPFRSKGGH